MKQPLALLTLLMPLASLHAAPKEAELKMKIRMLFQGLLDALSDEKNLSYAVLQATLKTTQKRGFSTTNLCAKLALKRDLF